MERIRGPIQGVYVVSYACAMGELGNEFVGYTKVCKTPPDGFWDAPGAITHGDTCFRTAAQAMDNSEDLALRMLRN
jgi:hypothetical protein